MIFEGKKNGLLPSKLNHKWTTSEWLETRLTWFGGTKPDVENIAILPSNVVVNEWEK